MNCFYHPDQEAVAQCVDCQKGLCASCATKYDIIICEACNKARARKQISYYARPFYITAILYVLVYYICVKNALPADETYMHAYMFSSLFIGWRITSRILEYFVLVGGCIFWLLLFFGIMFVGAMTLPIYLPYCLFQIVRIKRKVR